MITVAILLSIWFIIGLYATVDCIRQYEDVKLVHIPGIIVVAILLGPFIYLDFETEAKDSPILFRKKK